MTITTRTSITAVPLYPGSFTPEDGRPVELPDARMVTALAVAPDDEAWFALEVRTVTKKKWTDGDGGVMWLSEGRPRIYRIYVGEALTIADIERMVSAGDRYDILLQNMRGNDWPRVVRTRLGNFQPLEVEDVVISPAELAGR